MRFFPGGCGKAGENTALGMEALKALDYQSAIENFDVARAAGESGKELARAEGIAYLGMTQYSQAAACFLEALSYSDGWVEDVDYDINFYLAAAYTKEGRLQEAEEIYSAILDMQPGNEDALFLRGNARMGLDDYEAAKEDFDKVIAMDGKNFDRLIQIYEVLHSHGYKEAGQIYLRAAMDAGGEQMSAYDKGRMYYYLEEYQSAYLALETAKDQGGAEDPCIWASLMRPLATTITPPACIIIIWPRTPLTPVFTISWGCVRWQGETIMRRCPLSSPACRSRTMK